MEVLLNKVLKEKELTYRQAAKLTGISSSTLFDIAKNGVIPRIDVLEQIAKGLDVKICDLFESPYK